MEFADDDVSVSSGSEEEEEGGAAAGSDEEFGDDSDHDGGSSEEGAAAEAAAAAPTAAAAAPPAAAAAAATSGEQELQAALLNGELSTQAALLQLEVNELLSEVALCRQPGKAAAVAAAVDALATALATLPTATLTPAAAAAASVASIIASLGSDAQAVSLQVQAPASVQLVGGWALGAAADLPGATVDVAVVMPASSWHHKDHLNFRYHAKRALYVSQLAAHLAAHPVFGAAQQALAPLHGDPRRPVLLLHLGAAAVSSIQHKAGAAGAHGGLVLRLLPVVGLDTFELSKLAPDRNNIRWVAAPSSSGSKGAKQQQQPAAAAAAGQRQDGSQEQQLLPTPQYNAALLHDMLLLVNASKQAAAAAAAGGSRFVDALLLLKVWAEQHGLSSQGVLPAAGYACHDQQQQQQQATPPQLAAAAAVQADGLSGHLLAAALTASLSRPDSAAAAMSPLQQMRCALQVLADKAAWSKGGLALPRDSTVPVQLRAVAEQQQQAAGAVPGQVSKDHARLQQKLQQQAQQLPPPPATGAVFRKQYDATLLDSSGHLNLAACVSSSMLQLVQRGAQQTLAVLSRTDLEPDAVYGAVFRPGRGLPAVCDYAWTVELPEPPASSSQQPGDQHGIRLAEVQVEGLVRAALGSRARLVKALRRTPLLTAAQQQHQQQQPGSSTQKKKKGKHSGAAAAAAAAAASSVAGFSVPRRITVGAAVDPVAALRLVDVGPAADDAAAAAKFRQRWGDKSELRRFQDGKICEAVVWEGVPPGQRHRIPDMAVAHVLLRHLPDGTVVQSSAAGLDPLLYAAAAAAGDDSDDEQAAVANASWEAAAAGSSSGVVAVGASARASAAAAAETAASRAADAALDALAKQLRGLSDLALKVIGVTPLSSASRHTCAFYPQPHPLADGSGARAYAPGAKVPRVLEAIEVMVQLESTGKMPLDAAAFAKTKAALGVQLASALAAASGAHVTATEEALEVLWQGFAYRLVLHLDRDAAMAGGAAGGSTGQQPLPLLLSHHHGLVSALEAAHAAFGPTVRLAKRWVGAQLMLGDQLSEEAVELLVAAVFQGPSTTGAPGSRVTGLLAFLHLLASFPWSAAPLLVDPSGEVKQDARRHLQAEFAGRQAAGMAPGIYLATPYDLHSSRWTQHHPSAPVTAHLVALARAAASTLSQLLLMGPDAPAAQQQLALLKQQQQTTANGSHGSSKKKRAAEQQQALVTADAASLCRLEMRALGDAWRLLSAPALASFDAWLVLRREALPFADRADPLALQQLQVLLAKRQRQQRRLAAAAAAGGGSKQSQPGSSALQGLLGGGVLKCDAPKNARAILRTIPEQVLLSKPADKLRHELLVGFDPVKHYLSLAAARYGHLAAFCGDSGSGFGAIGIKWLPAAFMPAPLRPALAHGRLEIGVSASAGGGGKKGGGSRGLLVPNLTQVLSELAELGVGLVDQVVLL